ncbi:MAG: aldo/keto reductase [Spirochaetales bacterium]|nr:aldo/keto reductase [Spirochaetales bacterium]
MKKIRIPNTDIDASRLALGCMGLGGGWNDPDYTDVHVKQMRAFLDTAEEIGANFFDHADIYTKGKAERVFGQVMKERPSLRDKIFLQSKCGILFADDPQGSPHRFDFSADHIRKSVDGILGRLCADHLDILLLHRPDILWEGEEIAGVFRELKKAGKVRYFGVSNQNRFQMEYLQNFLDDPLTVNQLEMNLLHQGFAEVGISFNQYPAVYPNGWEGVIEYCRLKGVLLQAWSPLARGALTGADSGKLYRNVRKTAILVKKMAKEKGVSSEAIVLAWLLRHPAGIQPVLGTTRSERLKACAQADGIELSREEWYALFVAARGVDVP